MRRFILALALALAPLAASAATISVTDSPTLLAALKAAAPGDKIVMAPGDYTFRFGKKSWSPVVTLDATAARITAAQLDDVTGLNIVGGTWLNGCTGDPTKACYNSALRVNGGGSFTAKGGDFRGPEFSAPGAPGVGADGYGLSLYGVKNSLVENNTFHGLKVSLITTSGVENVTIRGNRFWRMRSDGINLGFGTYGALVENNVCDSTRILGAEHPDCIQSYSRPDWKPNSDFVIRGNVAVGDTQGIFFGNHVRPQKAGYRLWTGTVLATDSQVDDGGFDNVVIENNFLVTGFPNGIVGGPLRGKSAVRNNTVRTVPGSKWMSQIRVDGPALVFCGNTFAAYAGKKGLQQAPCQ